jgi:hypothetical protein
MKKKFVIALLWVFVNVLALAQQGPPQQLPSVSAANQQSLSSSLVCMPSRQRTRHRNNGKVMKSPVTAGQSRTPVSIPLLLVPMQ